VKAATLLLWKGHCSVHQRFRPEHVAAFRAEHPDGIVLIHPECAHDVVEMADEVGSTDAIIRAVEAAPAGSAIGVGTEIHLVKRLADTHPDKQISCLDPLVCPCSTMFRIDAPHLCLGPGGTGRGEVATGSPSTTRRPAGPGGPRAHAGHHLNGASVTTEAWSAVDPTVTHQLGTRDSQTWGTRYVRPLVRCSAVAPRRR
jgi:hypothetical protein